MTTALRRRLTALQNLAVDRGATLGEAAAALEAIARIRARLRQAGEPLVLDETEPSPASPSKRRARRKASHERPKQHKVSVGVLTERYIP